MSSLFLEGVTSRAKVLPLVHYAIIDHYARRTRDQNRVIGTLLGTVNGTNTEITNCFPVPHSETDEQVAVDMEYHRTMYDLYQKVNPREVIVGWYATGFEVTEHSTLIHDFYSRETENPIHLCIDTLLHDNKMAINAFVRAPMGVPEENMGFMFTPIKCELLIHEAERVGLDVLARSLPTDARVDGRVNLLTDLEQVSSAVDNLQKLIGDASAYVEKVLAGEKPGDPEIGRFLLDTVAAVPKVEASSFEKMFHNTLQDLLMVTYLANLTRTQVSFQEKLNQIL
jgi:translation initiation factor 3 subunit F